MLRSLILSTTRRYLPGACVPLAHQMASYTHLMKEKAFINGSWVASSDGQTFEVLNPANGAKLATVPNMGVNDTHSAIAAARDSFLTWRRTTPKQRAQILQRWHQVMVGEAEALAALITAENGKTIAESAAEVTYGSDFLEWFASGARRVTGEVLTSSAPSKRLLTLRQPVGPVAVITPWNFPVAMITRKVGAALAAGCSVVIKPAEDTPLTALALAALAHEAGLPPGVLNVVTCSHQRVSAVGAALCESPAIQCVSFTGSTPVGRELLRQCAPTVKRVHMELGGHAPFIVFESANVEKAVQGVMGSKFRCTGQTCISPNRFFVHASKYDAFVEALTREVEKLSVGDGTQPGVHQGPLINKAGVDKVERHVKNALELGAKTVLGGQRLEGNFFQPTVLTNCSTEMECFKEETFGPMAAIMKFSDEAEMLKMANALSVGLAGYFYSEDLAQIWRVAEALEVGMVGVNEALISGADIPFGGVKESGLGREGGIHGIDEYLETKYVCMGNIN